MLLGQCSRILTSFLHLSRIILPSTLLQNRILTSIYFLFAVNNIPARCDSGLCYATDGSNLCQRLNYPCGGAPVTTTLAPPSPICDFRCTNVGSLTASVTCKYPEFYLLHVDFFTFTQVFFVKPVTRNVQYCTVSQTCCMQVIYICTSCTHVSLVTHETRKFHYLHKFNNNKCMVFI